MFNAVAQYIQRPTLALVTHQPTLRKIFAFQAAISYRPVRDVQIHRCNWGGVPGLEIRPKGVTGAPRLLYLHGGGFTIGSATTHKWLAARLAKRAGCAAFVADYRLAPEHPFPAAVEDAQAAFEALAAEDGGGIAVAGDSAGGCLALGLSVTHRPLRAVLFSPLVDMSGTATGEIDTSQEKLLPKSWVMRAGRLYVGEADRSDPRLSPILADLSDLPPMLVQVGQGEMLEPHSRVLAERGANVRLDVTEGVAHVWQLNAGWMAKADRAVASAGQFLAEGFGQQA